MHPKSLFRRHVSAPMVLSLIALFIALGGVGWAATQLPPGSVGTSQIQKNAVTFRKIHPGAVGIRRINTRQVQVHVSGTCTSASAIGGIRQFGGVNCNPALPKSFSSSGSVPVGTTSTTVASKASPSGPVLAFAFPYAAVSGGSATVDCKLTVPPSASQTRTVTNVPADTVAAMPLVVAGTVGPPGGTVSVACSKSGTATVTVTGSLSAIQTFSNS
jgi:hypothetical protein